MFELKISADGADDLISNIKNLAAAMGASTSPAAIEAATEQKPRRTRKAAEPEQTEQKADSAASDVAKSDSAESTTGTPDPEQPAEEPTASEPEASEPEPETAQGDADDVPGPSDMSSYDSVKDWVKDAYLIECFTSQPDRAAAFQELLKPFGTTSLKTLPEDKWPALVAVVKNKIKAAGK